MTVTANNSYTNNSYTNNSYTPDLWAIAKRLLSAEDLDRLVDLTDTHPFAYDHLVSFDHQLGGPSAARLDSSHGLAVEDRDVFRPLQYCQMQFDFGSGSDNPDDLAWRTRHIVQMSGLHLESVIKRVGGYTWHLRHLPLGAALYERSVQRRVDPATWQQLSTFSRLYNACKHTVDHPAGTHLFSVEDAVLAYVVSRQLGMRLYPQARLKTDPTNFSD